MKRKLLTLAMLSTAVFAFAQQDFYALTGKNSANINFNDFRTLDVQHGVSGEIIFGSESNSNVFSQVYNRNVTEENSTINSAKAPSQASLAFDRKANKLVYIPMFSSNVYILDQATKNITLVESNVVKSSACDIATHITRMTAGYDGNIYSMSNSGSQLLKISNRNGKYIVEDLGSVRNDSANGQNALNIMNTGFGGDMIADADNNLYVFSASGNVFKVSPKLMNATFLGKIQGLPQNYSLNGAAVNAKGNVVVASARGENMFEVNLNDLTAQQVAGNLKLNIYDLASPYFAFDKLSNSGVFATNDVYPTKVDENFINVRIDDQKINGNINVEVYDVSGGLVLQKTLNSIEKNRTQKIELNHLISGVYVVSVKDSAGKTVLNKKISVK